MLPRPTSNLGFSCLSLLNSYADRHGYDHDQVCITICYHKLYSNITVSASSQACETWLLVPSSLSLVTVSLAHCPDSLAFFCSVSQTSEYLLCPGFCFWCHLHPECSNPRLFHCSFFSPVVFQLRCGLIIFRVLSWNSSRLMRSLPLCSLAF